MKFFLKHLVLNVLAAFAVFCLAASVFAGNAIAGDVIEVNILGRVTETDPTWGCQRDLDASASYYGKNCGGDWCLKGTSYTVVWSQPQFGRQGKLYGNDCWGDRPRYTSEYYTRPYADDNGEDITITITMDDPNAKINRYYRATAYPNGASCISTEEGFFAVPGPSQTLTTKIYDGPGDCDWNIISFESIPGPVNLAQQCLVGGVSEFSWTPVPQQTSYILKIDYDPSTGRKGENYTEQCCNASYPWDPTPTVTCNAAIVPNYNYIGWGVSSALNCNSLNLESAGTGFICVGPTSTPTSTPTPSPTPTSTPTPSPTPYCLVTFEPPLNFPLGKCSSQNVRANVYAYNDAQPDSISFTTDPSGYLSLDPAGYSPIPTPFPSPPFGLYGVADTKVTALKAVPEVNLTANAPSCSTTNSVNITVVDSVLPWWQVQDADLQAGTGQSGQEAGIVSNIPNQICGVGQIYFDLPGDAGFPGIPFASGYVDSGGGKISLKGWVAHKPTGGSVYSGPVYNFEWFYKNIPSQVKEFDCGNQEPCQIDSGDINSCKAGLMVDDYCWIKRSGDLTISGGVLTRKAVVFVSGKLTVLGDLSFPSGGNDSFFGVFAKGNIEIDPAVSGLVGLYLTDSDFITGYNPSGVDTKLNVSGSIISWDFVELQRNLGTDSNRTDPSELIIYSPELIMNFPKELVGQSLIWREITP